MKPEELIQLLRTTTIAQIRTQLEKDYEGNLIRYDHLVTFILSAHEIRRGNWEDAKHES